MGRPKKHIIETTTEIVQPISTPIVSEIQIVKTIEEVKPIRANETSIINGEKVALKNTLTGKMVAMSVSKGYANEMVKNYPHLEIL